MSVRHRILHDIHFNIAIEFITNSLNKQKVGKNILILGAGFGGLTCANILRKSIPTENEITVIDKKQYFMMGLVNLWILNGTKTLEESQAPLNKLTDKGIKFINDEITNIDLSNQIVNTKKSLSSRSSKNNKDNKLKYDYLIIALGAEHIPKQIGGYSDNDNDNDNNNLIFNLYEPFHIPRLREKILALRKGKVVICISSIPYKCPPAPYEASLLINNILKETKTRNNIDIDIYTPTPIALPVAGPKVSQEVIDVLNTNQIYLHVQHKLKRIFSNKQMLEFGTTNSNQTDDGINNVHYDLLVLIPPHTVPAVIRNSDLIDKGQNWINVNKYTLRTKYENVFAIGDVTEIKINQTLAIPKAGVFAEQEAKVVSQQIIDEITGTKEVGGSSASRRFDGKGFCFMEVGDKKAGYVDADFYHESGPLVRLEMPSEESYKKKIEFERTRINEWLMS